ncbi:hypothetical protein HGI15_21450, partial [Modestobacter lapidis]|nr:hypothetical protein [Modestobacter lapidis]
MTDSPYAIPAEDLVASARIERRDQVEVRPLLDAAGSDWSASSSRSARVSEPGVAGGVLPRVVGVQVDEAPLD